MSLRWRSIRGRYKVLIALAVTVAVIAGVLGYYYQKYYLVERYNAVDGKLTVKTEKIGKLGTVLVTNKGYALYMFPPDNASQVSCTGSCATDWPPLIVPDDAQLAAGSGVHTDLLDTLPDRDGKQVVTYNGWPLYTYLGDADPHQAKGQGVKTDGDYWFVVRPSGEIVKD